MTREGILMILFDLPQKNAADKRDYAQFRKHLKRNAFVQLQESVYVKHMRNLANVEVEKTELKANAPADGDVWRFLFPDRYFRRYPQSQGKESTMI